MSHIGAVHARQQSIANIVAILAVELRMSCPSRSAFVGLHVCIFLNKTNAASRLRNIKFYSMVSGCFVNGIAIVILIYISWAHINEITMINVIACLAVAMSLECNTV